MPVALSRRALLALLVSPVLAAGCGAGEPAPTASPASTATPTGPPPVATSGTASVATPAAAPSAGPTAVPSVGPTRPPATGVAAQVDLANVRFGGRLVEGWTSDVRTLNPAFVTDVITGHATSLLFSGLVTINPDTLRPESELAESWQVAADGKGYTFRLRANLTFHDGKPCTAEDVKFTYDLLLNERVSAPRQAELAAVLEQVNVTSPNEVEFRLKQVSAPFLVTHASYGILPKHLVGGLEPAKVEQSEFSLVKPVGAGPYRVKEWQRGASLTLARFEGYHAGKPYLDDVVFKVVPSAEVLLTQLKVGEVDVALVREIDVEELSRQQNLLLQRVDSLSITFLAFQLDPARTPLFQDQRVRQALGLALDREALIRLGRAGVGKVATGPVPPPSWAASDQLANRLTFNPARAEQLLDTAGWRRDGEGNRVRDGKKLAFELLTNRGGGGNRVREQYGQLIQEAWRKIGVDLKLTLVEFQEVVNRLRKTREFETVLTSFAFDYDPDQRLLWSTDAYRNGFNAMRYSNTALDQLLTEAVQTLDQSRRRDLYLKAQELVLADLPAIVIDYPQAVYAVNKRLRNIIPTAIGLGYRAHQWWASDGK